MPISLVVFDLDGTLINTIGDIHHALNLALLDLNMPPCTQADTIRLIGTSVDDMLEGALPIDQKHRLSDLRKKYQWQSQQRADYSSELYPGVEDTLKTLQSWGIQMAVLTNKPQLPAQRVIDRFKLTSYFQIIAGPDTFGAHKPNPKGLNTLISTYGINSASTVMIGDSEPDILVGQRANTRTIALSQGYRSAAQLQELHPTAIAASMKEALAHLQTWI
jgi:phosphoglycolate phosphatase